MDTQMSRNVHFSPIVSKLRYHPTILESKLDSSSIPKCIRDCDKNSPFHFDLINEHNNGNNNANPPVMQKVKVQEITKPVLQQTVQKIQISLPQNNGNGSERYSIDLMPSLMHHNQEPKRGVVLHTNSDRVIPSNSNQTQTRDITLNSNSFPARDCVTNYSPNKNSISSSSSNNTLSTEFKHHQQRIGFNEDDCVKQKGFNNSELSYLAAGTEDSIHGLVFSAFDSTSITSPSASSISCRNCHDKTGACGCIMKAPVEAPTKMCDKEMPMKINNFEPDVDLFNFYARHGTENHNKTENHVCFENGLITPTSEELPSYQLQISRNINVIGSLECIQPEVDSVVEGEQVVSPRKTTKNKTSLKEEDGESNSWPASYYRKVIKDKSKPKLSLLQRITFGRFGNNSEKETKSPKKSQKRSSCPPLGHPLLLQNSGVACANDRRNSGTVIEKSAGSCDEVKQFNDLNLIGNSGGVLTTSQFVDDKCTRFNKDFSGDIWDKFWTTETEGTNKNIDEPVRELDYTKYVTKELPPKPTPRKKYIQRANETQVNGKQHNTHLNSLTLQKTFDSDEFSVKFEEIMEGIWDVEPDDPITLMEQKALCQPFVTQCCFDEGKLNTVENRFPSKTSSSSNDLDNANNFPNLAISSLKTNNGGSQVKGIPEEACNSVVGKPPKPPITGRQIGMRSGATERFSYLKGRMNATATTETRLAMELAAKLCEFREELHRSREQIAKSHPNLDEIESSVRTTLAIDRTQRILPQSRSCTGRAPLPTSSNNNNCPANINGGYAGSVSSTSSRSAATAFPAKEKATQPKQPVKSVSEIISEEWESVVLRAKENFSRSSYNQRLLDVQVPSANNGKSGDPCHSEASLFLLESDLDTGAVREFPVDNSFNYGDSVRLRDLERVLKVEDLSTSSFVQKNSCSLQNLSLCGEVPKMATLKPGDPGGGSTSGTNGGKEDRSRSMEFLIDESNKNAHLLPPENTLMKNQETRRMSEHELRIQRSLQKLNVPDWYKNYAPSGTVSAAVTPNKSRDFGSGTGLAGGWPGLSTSKTNSLTSLQSAGRYAGSKTSFGYGRHRTTTGTASTGGGRSSRESLMSPSSTASASPSPNFERSSFTYGMPYALTRFAAARMSCGASPASLSPSPSPVGGIGTSTSTPVSSGPAARYGYQKAPYLGWRSQERLASKSLYRSPAERLAADLIAQKKPPPALPVVEQPPPPQIEIRTSPTPKKETASSDLSLNNSEESNSHKLNRVRSSIKEVSNAIVDYVNETKPLDDGMNGRASPRRGLVWLESSFVGTKPIDSPGTPDTPSTFMSQRGSRKETNTFRFDETPTDKNKDNETKSGESSSTSHYTSYLSRNEQMEERSNSSSVSSPTLEDILDSLLALRRPNKKFRSRGKGHESTARIGGGAEGDSATTPVSQTPISPSKMLASTTTTSSIQQSPSAPSSYHQYQYEPSTTSEIYATSNRSGNKYNTSQTPPTTVSDWQERMNQPPADSTFLPGESETFTLTGNRGRGTTGAASGNSATSTSVVSISSYSSNNNQQIHTSSKEGQPTSRYSSVSSTPTTTAATGGNEFGGYGSSSYTTHSASSSIQSTPTHKSYHKQQNNQSSTPLASSKDYQHSSASSSPAKSCLIDSTQRDDNELRQSVLRTGGAATGAVGEEDEELAFGNPTEIRSTVTSSSVAPITGGVIVNPLTGLSEYSNPPTPARHRRVSFDLDFSDKEEKSSSRSKNKDETVGGTIQCRNTKCGKTATGLEARREFKVCHNCNAYYCSRECRRAHWEKHKKTCMQSRVGAICKQIISHVKEDSYVMNQLSTTAKRGFLAKGRGCVKLFYNSPDRAERFLTGGLPELPEPLFLTPEEMLPEEMGAQTFSELSEQCRSYNPDTRFVLYTCVCVVNEVPTYGAVKWERELISRSSKLRLLLPRNFFEENQRHHHAPANPAHLMPTLADTTNSSGGTSPVAPASGLQSQKPSNPLYDTVPSIDDFPPPPLPPHHHTTASATTTTASPSENDTLILRSVPPPSSHQLNSNEHKRLREVSFANIQKHLLLRGVDLKRTYPDIFMKLCKYVEHDEPFLPVTIYPKNSETGRQFVCVIMPESSDSAYTAATEESGQRHPLQRVETINISEQDDDEILDIT